MVITQHVVLDDSEVLALSLTFDIDTIGLLVRRNCIEVTICISTSTLVVVIWSRAVSNVNLEVITSFVSAFAWACDGERGDVDRLSKVNLILGCLRRTESFSCRRRPSIYSGCVMTQEAGISAVRSSAVHC